MEAEIHVGNYLSNLKSYHCPLYILSLHLYVIKNKELFTTNNEVHSIHTRQQLNFHQPSADVTKYQTGVYYMGLKIFKTLPPCIKQESDNPKKFESLLKKFLYEN